VQCDLTLDQTFAEGSYACRPLGMGHGHWRAPEGCLTFEARYSGTGPAPQAPSYAQGARPA
jgi:hypothetical protein